MSVGDPILNAVMQDKCHEELFIEVDEVQNGTYEWDARTIPSLENAIPLGNERSEGQDEEDSSRRSAINRETIRAQRKTDIPTQLGGT